ncbi:pre-toxin TG domain-containing protein [Streptococcus plurextorum]
MESPYKATLQKSYQAFKKSDAYKEHKLSQDEYLMAMHHTRAFSYHSLDDDRENTEMWRDLALGAGVVILTIFCPPAGLTAGVVLASADMYSAATGKDWGTGRELDTTERGLRAGFALFDLIPGVGYINDVAKSGSKLAAKEFLQTSLKEGLEQGVKNLDSFKGLVKNVRQFGDNVLKNIDHYAKQVGNLTKGKVASAANNLASQLRHADDTLSKAAQNFSLNNIGFEPQLVSGAIPTPPPGRLSGVADNLQAFAKSLSGSVDEVGNESDKLLRRNKRIDFELVNQLAKQNVKYNPDEIIIIGKDSSGKIMWLEKGNNKAGYEHILVEHGEQFVKQGVSNEMLPDYLMDALTNGKVIGYQGRGTGRPIYEFIYNGQTRRVAITAGNNGFIVGANPVSVK